MARLERAPHQAQGASNRCKKRVIADTAGCSQRSRVTLFSKYTSDRDSRTAPTYDEALRSRTERYVWPDFLGKDTDSSESLKKLSIPGLWLFSDNDASIPVGLSIERLQALRMGGHRYDYVLFSGLGHNNMDGTFATAVDWIKRLPDPFSH